MDGGTQVRLRIHEAYGELIPRVMALVAEPTRHQTVDNGLVGRAGTAVPGEFGLDERQRRAAGRGDRGRRGDRVGRAQPDEPDSPLVVVVEVQVRAPFPHRSIMGRPWILGSEP